jgi:DNA polymerase IV
MVLNNGEMPHPYISAYNSRLSQPSNEADDKATFFDELYALSQLSEDELDTDESQNTHREQTHHESCSMSAEVRNATMTPDSGINQRGVRRTASLPVPTSLNPTSLVVTDVSILSRQPQNQRQASTVTTASTIEASVVEETPSAQHLRQRRAPRRTISAPTPSAIVSLGEMNKSSLGKRKRKQPPVKLVPEAQRIFSGCTFFFIPNDDIAPMRRARIRKAQEHGAIRSSIWCEEITHIIVDKPLSYEDIVSYLKIPCIPQIMTMVNDTYPIDCIQFKAMLDATQRQYRVRGHEQALEKKAAQTQESQTSDKSLQLKPAQSKPGKWDYVPPRATPPRSEASTQNAPNVRRSEPLPTDVPINTENDVVSTPEGGALDEMIREARTLTHLPLDEDDFDRPPSRDETIDTDDTSDESNSGAPSKAPAPLTKSYNKGAFDQKNFSCMKGGTGTEDTSNPNSLTVSILQEMADYYTRINDTWRPIAYRKAISALRRQPNKVTTSEEAFKLPCVGQRLALKIEEIVNTDRLRRLENAKTEPGDHILQKFMGIYGVGFSQANKWLHSGYSTLEDLKKHAHLTDNQLLGIEHYDDFQTRIPRDEVTALGDIVKAAANSIDPEVEIIIGGSYRRRAATSGDIDCIITKPKTCTSNDIFPFLGLLVSKLTSSNFLVAALAVPRSESGSKWHGCCVLPGTEKLVWRRIDFLLVPASELGAALLYFTGNDIFNRSIRLLASRKGMRLNQRGLYKDVMRGPGRVKLNDGELVEGADEKKIFAALGVPWRPPEQRIC